VDPLRDPDFWFLIFLLAICLCFVATLPWWWRSFSVSSIRWRDRAYGVTVLAFTVLAGSTIGSLFFLNDDTSGVILVSYLVGAVLVCLIPLVGWWRRFDFAVPRRLLVEPITPEQWASPETLAHGNRRERRLKGRMRRPRRR
jgi:FtsH-binding integral membrane protein